MSSITLKRGMIIDVDLNPVRGSETGKVGCTEKTFNTEAQSARRKKKVRFGEEFLCELPLFSPCPPCLCGEMTFLKWSQSSSLHSRYQ